MIVYSARRFKPPRQPLLASFSIVKSTDPNTRSGLAGGPSEGFKFKLNLGDLNYRDCHYQWPRPSSVGTRLAVSAVSLSGWH